jgi:hypothetical protein
MEERQFPPDQRFAPFNTATFESIVVPRSDMLSSFCFQSEKCLRPCLWSARNPHGALTLRCAEIVLPSLAAFWNQALIARNS